MITIINIGNVIHIKREAVDLDSFFMVFYSSKTWCMVLSLNAETISDRPYMMNDNAMYIATVIIPNVMGRNKISTDKINKTMPQNNVSP